MQWSSGDGHATLDHWALVIRFLVSKIDQPIMVGFDGNVGRLPDRRQERSTRRGGERPSRGSEARECLRGALLTAGCRRAGWTPFHASSHGYGQLVS